MIPLPVSLNWVKVAAGAALLAAVLGYVWYCEHEKAAFATFRAEVEVLGKAAQREAEETAAANKQAQENANAELQALRSRVAALTQRLHDARTRGSYVPPAPAASVRPDLACFDRAALDAALRRLDAGVQGLIDEGDEAIDGLSVARRWAATVGQP